jgi:hypothetical protein
MVYRRTINKENILCDLYQKQKYDRFWELMGEPDELPCNFTEECRRCISSNEDEHKNVPYIIIGEECPICYEPLLHAKNSYFTKCGHKLHKSCITNMFDAHNNSDTINFCCPICRQDMGYCDWLVEGMSFNRYDNLELFIDCIDRQQCTFGKHHIGTHRNNGCISCNTWAYTTKAYYYPKVF